MNSATDWLCSAPLVRGVVSNPIFTALLIVSLAAIVVMALYHYQIKRAGLKRGIRAFLYVFLLVLAVVVVHHYAVVRSATAVATQQGVRDVFSSIEQSRASDGSGSVLVRPHGYEDTHPSPGPPNPPDTVLPPVITGGDCGCPRAVPAGHRPDNVAPSAGLVIEDVIIPAAASPFSGPGAKMK